MTLRAFLIGLACVAGVCLLDPLTSFNKFWGWNTVGHFPPAAVFFLVVFTAGLNPLIRLARRSWAMRQAELMLIWCMLIVACIVPSDGLMRWWMPMLAGPAYIARRADIPWQETSLQEAPDRLLLTKKPNSMAARQFYEGRPEGGRFPLAQWLRPIGWWALLMAPYYLAIFLVCALIRRQWVETERLQFPLARVPLEFTEDAGGGASDGGGWLPALFRSRAFLGGLLATAVFRFLRAVPLLFGKDAGWDVALPFKDVLAETPLEHLYLQNFSLWWSPIGFAYLVPADVSLSVWLFYLFGRVELQVAHAVGSPLHYGGTWSQLMRWQVAGSYFAFTVGALFMARRHLQDIFRKAVGRGRGVSDAEEPVHYAVGFWGLLACLVGCVAWFVAFGMKAWVAGVFVMLLMCIAFVNARIVAQSGLYVTTCLWQVPNIMNGLGGGFVFGPRGAAIANMQYGTMVDNNYSMLSPAAVHAFRIGEVFGRRRKLLLPVLFVTLAVGIGCSTFTCLKMSYDGGALNFKDDYGPTGNPKYRFDLSHQMIENPGDVSPARWWPLGIGAGLTGAVMFMRARFYWWPVHPIGLLALSNWHADRIWLPFLLGWLLKVCFMKFGSGRLVREARSFMIGLIMVETFVGSVSTIVRTLSRGDIPGF
jgi:hypothetical protein